MAKQALNFNIKNDDELATCQWLIQTGFKDIQFLQNPYDPPDFVVKHHGKTMAVEVCRVSTAEALDPGNAPFSSRGAVCSLWTEELAQGITKKLETLVAEAASAGFHWHAAIDYDSDQCAEVMLGRKRERQWKSIVKEYLRTPRDLLEWLSRCQSHAVSYDASHDSGAIPLQLVLDRNERNGRGVVLCLSEEEKGLSLGVDDESGCLLWQELADRIIYAIEKKSKNKKALSRYKAAEFDQWWLVLADHVLVAEKEVLSSGERTAIEQQVAAKAESAFYDKVVLLAPFSQVSRGQRDEMVSERKLPELPATVQPKRSWVLWERGR